jgi:hypothetical protein
VNGLVEFTCTGRPVTFHHGGAIDQGETCGAVLFTSFYTLAGAEAEARARGWKLGPVRPDGTRDVMCRDCGKPDRDIAKILRGSA